MFISICPYRTSCVQSSLLCLSWPGSVRPTTSFCPQPSPWTTCLYSTQTPALNVSPTDLDWPPVDSILLLTDLQLNTTSLALIAASTCIHSFDYAASKQIKIILFLSHFLYCSMPLISAHTCMKPCILSPTELEIKYPIDGARLGSQPNWLNQNKTYTFCLIFAPIWLIYLIGELGFLFKLNLRKMILICKIY